ncbi:MAG: DUF6240 domain-containing protein [Butyrivibrio sp.]|nr:DUF6240 domain-containing protein [Muribaculum sp.]MCM1553642.1 DUF6240 domain-containing protein [Butyrivibrio sp.]
MNISFQNQDKRTDAGMTGYPERAEHGRDARTSAKTEGRVEPHGKASTKRNVSDSANVSFSASELGFQGFGGMEAEGRDKGKTLTELQQEAAYTDVGVSQDYMTVMSHTMSTEDYQELSKEGFHFESLDPEEAVTIVDKIKAELVRSGQYVAGYTDDLDMGTLAAAVGSESLARALADSFQDTDIPLTEENIAEVKKAWDMASGLDAPTEGSYQYMVDNEMEPEIWNFYLAENSGADQYSRNPNIPRNDMAFLADENIQKQIDQVLEQAGFELDEENRQDAKWLLEHRLPLTEDSLYRLKDLKEAVLPVTEESFAEAVAEAVASGKDPMHANLSGNGKSAGNIYKKAHELLAYYSARYEELTEYAEGDAKEIPDWLRDQGELTARKHLEEIRLRMTAEVNVRLLKSGFAIDTAPMEELITALREAEQAVADIYFPQDAEAVAKYENWNQTNRVMEDLPSLPAQLIGTVRIETAGNEEATILEHFHAEGVILKQTYERAGESYEALMTAPRADLGDSMSKAFGNVDELVRELGMEPTAENQRAVRILGYNHMEITAENVARVKEADAQVQNLIEKMTPAATLKMLRDGVNPLEQSFAELNEYFDAQSPSYQEQSESYSRYLYGLEQNKQITAEEREAFIGVYRLLRQIERKDGAAIGAVVNMQAELQFSNLLSAVRSGKFRHMDARATDELGVLKDLVQKGETLSISEQISKGFQREELSELRHITQMDSTPSAMLERGEMPVNAANLLAAQKLAQDGESPFKTLREKEEELKGETPSSAVELWERLSDKEDFQTQYEESVADMQSRVEELTLDYAENSVDVRELRMAHRQLSIMGALSNNEEYFLPMYVGEQLAAVHLTMERSGKERGGISIAVDVGQSMHMEAHLQVRNNRVEGFLLGKTSEEVMKLQNTSDIFCDLINKNSSMDLEAMELPVVSGENINVTRTSEINSQGEDTAPDNGTLYRVAKLFLQAIR